MAQHVVGRRGQVVAYVRVSTVEQNLDRQLAVVGECDRVFTDQVSGRSRADRTGLEQCLLYLCEGDQLRVASMDRLARSLTDLRSIVNEIVEKGASVHFVAEYATYAPGSTDARAELMLNMLGAFAEFERSIIRERQAEGIALAQAAGRYKGRARALTSEQVRVARERIEAGIPKARIARELGVNRTTIYRSLERDHD